MLLQPTNLVNLLTVSTTVFLLMLTASPSKAQRGLDVKKDTLTKTVLIHPVIEIAEDEVLLSREHTYKKHLGLGDQLARDFSVATSNDEGKPIWYRNDGQKNQDYISWRKNVMAPISGKVVLVNDPNTTNKPGVMNRDAKPGRVYIKNKEGVTVTLVHVREITVEEDQHVKAGQVVAKVGNNGNSTGPHTHVGAWKGKTPLQIQVDLYAEKRFSLKE